jgi:hypothetical protein
VNDDEYAARVVKIMTTDNLLAHGYSRLNGIREAGYMSDAQRAGARAQRSALAREVTEVARRGHVGEALQLMTYARVAQTWPHVIAWGRHPNRATDYVTSQGNRYPRVIPTGMPAAYDIMTGRMRGQPPPRAPRRSRAAR